MMNNDTTTGPVTLRLKRYRYVFLCAGCHLLADSERSDAVTCSGCCRVRAHRSGEIKRLSATAHLWKVRVSGILQARALDLLCPQLSPDIMAGKQSMDDVRGEIWAAYMVVVRQSAGEAA